MSYVTISKWKNDPDFDRDVAIDIVQQKYVSAIFGAWGRACLLC